MLSFACRSRSRHGELILKGGGPQLGRGAVARQRGGPLWQSVLEETELSWVTSCAQLAGSGEAEDARWLAIPTRVFREQKGATWSHLRWVEEFGVWWAGSTSEEQSDSRAGGEEEEKEVLP